LPKPIENFGVKNRIKSKTESGLKEIVFVSRAAENIGPHKGNVPVVGAVLFLTVLLVAKSVRLKPARALINSGRIFARSSSIIMAINAASVVKI
jgi:hypothetical protein